jgi:diguanylate cyclase (GGDEF)-like protein
LPAEHAFQQLSRGFFSASDSEDVLEGLVRCVAAIFQVDHALIAGATANLETATTLAVWSRYGHVEPLSYALAGSPCHAVLEEQTCYYRDDVCSAFPKDDLLKVMGVEGYFGVPVLAPDGKLLGLLAILHNAPLELPEYADGLMQLAAARAGAELAKRQVMRQAYWDHVTDLPSRHQFMGKLEQACNAARRNGTSLALLHIDLHRFKVVNDLHGYAVGDRLLAEVAKRFQNCCLSDELIARLGADEYVALLPGVDVDGIPDAVHRFRQSINESFHIDGLRFDVTTSMGAACLPRHVDSAVRLMQCSGIALSHAKRSGLAESIFDDEMAKQLSRREQLKSRLAAAIKQQELTLHYQPQVDLVSQLLIGAEALCRWHDPEWGWIGPDEFIPLAEQLGGIEALGELVVTMACRQLGQWQDEGHPLPGRLSLNLSARQLDSLQLENRLLTLTRDIAPESLCFEITETAIVRTPEEVARLTRALRKAGFAIAIDDFGTGYSSLNNLKHFEADALKIDYCFVRDMLVSRQDHAIVSTIVSMAHGFGMRAIAEGVELEEQARALRSLGCNSAQGYLYGSPVDAENFARQWLYDFQ